MFYLSYSHQSETKFYETICDKYGINVRSCRSLNKVGRVRFHTSPCGIFFMCCQVGGFPPQNYRCPLSASPCQSTMLKEIHVVVCSIQDCIPGTVHGVNWWCRSTSCKTCELQHCTWRQLWDAVSLASCCGSAYDRYPPNRKHWPGVPLFNELL